ncbi:MAG TPA: polysaccharide biosynthesis/export family protein [Chthoniobacterales bacterium]|nr:polysaccharide biosynthesis/export family protein [Chthoniobacterales bacterium]
MERIEYTQADEQSSAGNRNHLLGRFIGIAVAVAAVMAALSTTSCTSANRATAEQAAAPAAVTLVAGDVIKLTFPGAPELNQSQKIRTDGKVNLPLIGEVSATGKTVPALQDELAQLYKSELKTSTVIVTLESSVTQVTISGAVGRPGKLVFERPTTVFQAIMEAGGATEFGTLRNVHLVRLINGLQKTEILDLRPVVSGQETKPYYVRDGDVIVVQKTLF